eukprot:scaffold295_cov97-Alexandrium_tamarense.AAC.6
MEKFKILLASMVVSVLYLYHSPSSVILSSFTLKPSHVAKVDESSPSMNINKDQDTTIECNGSSCTDSVGILGDWVDVGSNRSFAAPVCCAWDAEPVFFNGAQCRKEPAPHLYSGNQDNSYQQLGVRG